MGSEALNAAWGEASECRRTWFGDLSIDYEAKEAVLLVTVTEERRFQLHIPRSRIDSLMRELDWAQMRLAPAWTGDHPPVTPGQGDDDEV